MTESTAVDRFEPSLYKELRQSLRDAGCFEAAPASQMTHMLLVLIAYAAGYLFLLSGPSLPARLAALLVLAVANVQAGYIAHEAGHGAITRNTRLADFIGHVFSTLLTALAYSHFQYIHTRHHTCCNDPGRDPDIRSGIFSLYPGAVAEKRGRLGQLVSRYQGYLIWPLVSLQGFSLKADSIRTLRRFPDQTRVDQYLLVGHLLLWLVLPACHLGLPTVLANYLLMTWFIGPYLGSVFLVNHIGTHVIEPDATMPVFMQRLVTTRNLGSSRLADWFFGGINHHIEHHLFPGIPTARLARAREITRVFCAQRGLPYRETGWFQAAAEITRYLGEAGKNPGNNDDRGFVRSDSE